MPNTKIMKRTIKNSIHPDFLGEKELKIIFLNKESPSIHKNSQLCELSGWDGRIRTSEMPGPKPGALPLGDVPLPYTILLRPDSKVKKIFCIHLFVFMA